MTISLVCQAQYRAIPALYSRVGRPLLSSRSSSTFVTVDVVGSTPPVDGCGCFWRVPKGWYGARKKQRYLTCNQKLWEGGLGPSTMWCGSRQRERLWPSRYVAHGLTSFFCWRAATFSLLVSYAKQTQGCRIDAWMCENFCKRHNQRRSSSEFSSLS